MTVTKLTAICLASLVAVGLISLGLNQLYGLPIQLNLTRRRNPSDPKPFQFPRNYHATGKLRLPHNNIVEPFEVWFSAEHNRSRIDYYYGTDKTYQLADLGPYGEAFKVVPMYTDQKGNYIGCWHLAGTKSRPIVVQPVVPNMTDFKFYENKIYYGTSTAQWDYRYMSYGLLNTHTMSVTTTQPPRPVRYEMKGYDNLLASYYDHYILEYISFEEWKPDLDKFELPKGSWCYNVSHSLDSHLVSNPMQEFMSYGESGVEDMYLTYKEQHNKTYGSNHEHMKRKHIFRHNMRYIRSINRKNLKYKLAPNHLADLTDEEYDQHLGLSEDKNIYHKGSVYLKPHHNAYSNMSHVLKKVDVPDELDWRDYGAVSAVRGQGICGSCYALAAAGAVEGAFFMKTGRLVELSAQQVVDCSWGSGNHGCRGGYYNKALSWIYMHGIASAEDYGPYLAQEGTCQLEGLKRAATIDAFAFVPKYNNTALKISVARFGPAAVSINDNPLSLKFYSWGIYDDLECDNSSSLHSVLVVGYGHENGIPYWLVKNSWSTSWGLNGYVKLAWKGNTCGVTKNPVVALMKHTSFQFPIKEKIKSLNPSDPDSMGRKIHPQRRPQGTQQAFKSMERKGSSTIVHHGQSSNAHKAKEALLQLAGDLSKHNAMNLDSRAASKNIQKSLDLNEFNRKTGLDNRKGAAASRESNVRRFTSRAERLRYERKRKRVMARTPPKQITGKSQDIYENLSDFIAASLHWENRKHALRYSHED